MDTPTKLSVVPVDRYNGKQVAADLREIADAIENDPTEARFGKFFLIRIADWECEGNPDGKYAVITQRSRMRASEAVAALETAKAPLVMTLSGMDGIK